MPEWKKTDGPAYYCVSCGLESDTVHRSAGDCVAALELEAERLRQVLDSLTNGQKNEAAQRAQNPRRRTKPTST